MCFPELTITAAERGRVVWVLPSSNWKLFRFKTSISLVFSFCIFEDISPADLQSIFAGGFEEDAGEELCAGLHLEPLLDLFALACEAAREKK